MVPSAAPPRCRDASRCGSIRRTPPSGGISDGDVVRLFNERGVCLAGAVVTDAMTRGVLQLQTGAWYDPDKPGEVGALDRHGNPNTLTLDKGTSKLAQGPISQTTLVEVERWNAPVPQIGAYDRPAMAGG